MKRPEHFLIAGAGLGGAFLALLLGRAGHRVDVFEKRRDPRQARDLPGRSISLVLVEKSLRFLEDLGLGSALGKISAALAGRIHHFDNGARQVNLYGEQAPADALFSSVGRGARAVLRPDLNRLLITAAEHAGAVRFYFEHSVTHSDLAQATLSCTRSDGALTTYRGSAVVGADGAASSLRAEICRDEVSSAREPAGIDQEEAPRIRESTLDVAYREVELPRDAVRGGRREAFVHVWPRVGALLVSVPRRDGSLTSAIFLPRKGEDSLEELRDAAAAEAFFRKTFSDLSGCAKRLGQSFHTSPTTLLRSLRCWPWARERAVLVGDACHVMVPFSGQGANIALEDCTVLERAVRRHAPDLPRAFAAYSEERKAVTDTIQKHSAGITPFVMYLMGAMPPPAPKPAGTVGSTP